METIGELTKQINARKSVGGVDLTAAQVEVLVARRAVMIARVKARVRVNAHTTAEANRTIGAVNAHTSAVLKQAVCPDLPPDASEQEELDALRARQKAIGARMAVLRGRTAAAKKEERDERPARKLVEKHAAKRDREVEKAAEKAVAKEEKAAARVVCGAMCRGTKQKPGKLCKQRMPCRHHPDERGETRVARLGAMLDELGVPAEMEGDDFLQALSEPQ